jgi:hypothetical protein
VGLLHRYASRNDGLGRWDSDVRECCFVVALLAMMDKKERTVKK